MAKRNMKESMDNITNIKDSTAALSPEMQLAKEKAKDKDEEFEKIVLGKDVVLGASKQPTPDKPKWSLDESLFDKPISFEFDESLKESFYWLSDSRINILKRLGYSSKEDLAFAENLCEEEGLDLEEIVNTLDDIYKNGKEKAEAFYRDFFVDEDGNPIEIDESLKRKKLSESYDDGWSSSIREELNDLTSELYSFCYEMENCVRGAYTGVETAEGLGDYLIDLGDRISSEGEVIKDYPTEDGEEDEFEESYSKRNSGKLKEAKSSSGNKVTLFCTFEPYERYGGGGRLRKVKATGTDNLSAISKLVDKMLLYIDSERIEEDEMTFEDVIDAIESSNGDGCDFIYELKDNQGNVYISDEYEEEYEDVDESLNESTWNDENRVPQPSTVKYKGFKIRPSGSAQHLNIYDSHNELVDSGFKTLAAAKKFCDENKDLAESLKRKLRKKFKETLDNGKIDSREDDILDKVFAYLRQEKGDEEFVEFAKKTLGLTDSELKTFCGLCEGYMKEVLDESLSDREDIQNEIHRYNLLAPRYDKQSIIDELINDGYSYEEAEYIANHTTNLDESLRKDKNMKRYMIEEMNNEITDVDAYNESRDAKLVKRYKSILGLDEDFEITEENLDDWALKHACNLEGANYDRAKAAVLGLKFEGYK